MKYIYHENMKNIYTDEYEHILTQLQNEKEINK